MPLTTLYNISIGCLRKSATSFNKTTSRSTSISFGKWDLSFQYFLCNCWAAKFSHIKIGILEGKSKIFMPVSFDLCSENAFDYWYHDVPIS